MNVLRALFFDDLLDEHITSGFDKDSIDSLARKANSSECIYICGRFEYCCLLEK